MSYAGLGIAIPMYRGVTSRSMPVARGVTARGVTVRGRGFGLGTALPSQPALATAAADAVAAVRAAAAAGTLRSSNAAVQRFQLSYGRGLTVDGIYGPNTRSALQTATGITDLPAAASSASSSSSSSSSSSYSSSIPDALPTEEYGAATSSSWMVPVAVVSVLVLVAGGLIYRQRQPVRKNARGLPCRTCGTRSCKVH